MMSPLFLLLACHPPHLCMKGQSLESRSPGVQVHVGNSCQKTTEIVRVELRQGKEVLWSLRSKEVGGVELSEITYGVVPAGMVQKKKQPLPKGAEVLYFVKASSGAFGELRFNTKR